MIEIELKVLNRAGIHTRPASKLVKLASRFKSELTISRGGFRVNGKSIIGVMTLAAEEGCKLLFQFDGVDEKEASLAIRDLIENKFDEV